MAQVVTRSGTGMQTIITIGIDSPGVTINISCKCPGVVIEKIMIDFGGLQKNYLGAPSSELIK